MVWISDIDEFVPLDTGTLSRNIKIYKTVQFCEDLLPWRL